jgi:hypothetical protein
MIRMLQMIKRKDYVESLRSELKVIRKKLHQSNHGGSVRLTNGNNRAHGMQKHYEGMEYVVREVVKSLEMGKGRREIEEALLVIEARFRKIIQAKVRHESSWQSYARGGMEGVVAVRALIV